MVDLDVLVKTLEKHGASWQLSDKLRALGSEAEVARALWATHKSKRTDLSGANNSLLHYVGAADAWNADDFCAMVVELQQRFPFGAFTGSARGWVHALPGSADGIVRLLSEKEGDAAFGEAMRARWASLPRYWGTTLAYCLVVQGQMPMEELTDDVMLAVARARLTKSDLHDYPRWLSVVTPARWRAALADVLVGPDTFTVETEEAMAEALPAVPLRDVPRALSRLPASYSYSPQQNGAPITNFPKGEPLAVLDGVIDRAWLEDAIAQTDHDPSPQPRNALLRTYARRCLGDQVVMSPRVDRALAAFLDLYAIPESSALDGLRDALALLPPERLEPLILHAKRDQWTLIASSPTEANVAHAVDRIAGLVDPAKVPYLPWDQQRYGPSRLTHWNPSQGDAACWSAPLAALVVPPAIAALARPKLSPHARHLCTVLLAVAGSPDGLPALFDALEHKDAALRAVALHGIANVGADAALSELTSRVKDRKKDTRDAAARCLASLPARADLHALAAVQAKVERIASIKAILETVRPPKGVKGLESSLADRLIASEGAAWSDHTGEPAALIEAFRVALANGFRDREVNETAPSFVAWTAAFEVLHAEPGAAELMLELAVASGGRPGIRKVLDGLAPSIAPAFEARVSAGWPARLPELGARPVAWSLADAMKWLAKQPLHLAGPSWVAALGSHQKERAVAVEALTEGRTTSLPHLARGLVHPQAAVRRGSLDVLDALRLPESLPALRAAALAYPMETATRALIAAMEAAQVNLEALPLGPPGDAMLQAALAPLPCPPWSWTVPFEGLPPLRFHDGAAMSEPAARWLLASSGQESERQREPKLPSIRERLTDASCAAVLAALQMGKPAVLVGAHAFATCLLGDDTVLDRVARDLEHVVGTAAGRHGRDALDALTRRGTPAAVRALEWASRRSGSNTIRRRSGDALSELAGWRGLTVPELLDEALSELGFDARGEQAFDFGGRPLVLKLGRDNDLTILDGDGRSLAGLPAARKGDDAAKVAEKKRAFSALKKALRAAHISQRRRLESYLVGQREYLANAWQARFLGHALMRTYARTLLWEALDTEGQTRATFLVMESDLMNVELEAVHLDSSWRIRLAHPLLLGPETIARWSEVFTDNEVLTTFPQLLRPTFATSSSEALIDDLAAATSGPWMGAMDRCGYEQGPRGDGGNIYSTVRQLARHRVTIEHQGYWPSDPTWSFDIERIVVTEDGKVVLWSALSAVMRSELEYDLRRLTGALP
jgi:hypothetical protein